MSSLLLSALSPRRLTLPVALASILVLASLPAFAPAPAYADRVCGQASAGQTPTNNLGGVVKMPTTADQREACDGGPVPGANDNR